MGLLGDAGDWRRAVAGDGAAFGVLFDRHRLAVRRQAARLAGSPADVEDVVAIVFLEAWRRRDTVRLVEGSMLPWLLTTAAYVCSNLRRSRSRYQALLDRLPVPEPVKEPGSDDEGALVSALRSLRRSDQQVLTLCVLEEFSERDAATVLGVPVGTVKSRLHRAKRRLADRFRLGENVGGEVRHGI